jgi:hypothetical protein
VENLPTAKVGRSILDFGETFRLTAGGIEGVQRLCHAAKVGFDEILLSTMMTID